MFFCNCRPHCQRWILSQKRVGYQESWQPLLRWNARLRAPFDHKTLQISSSFIFLERQSDLPFCTTIDDDIWWWSLIYIGEHNPLLHPPLGVGVCTAQAPCVSSAQSSRRFETKAEQSEYAELLRLDSVVPTGDIDATVSTVLRKKKKQIALCTFIHVCHFLKVSGLSGTIRHNINKIVSRRINKFITYKRCEETTHSSG